MYPLRQNGEALSVLRQLQKKGKKLLNQQCWLWGQDIQRSEGNLLLEYGFERLRAPEGKSGPTQYRMRLPAGAVVCLWGFGIYYGLQSGLFLSRYDFIGREARLAPGWMESSHFKALPRCYDGHALASAVAWMASYERWALERVGVDQRQAALDPWKKSVCRAGQLPDAWQQLATSLRSACALQAALPLKHYDRQSAQTPYTKYSWLVAENPRGSLGLPWKVQPWSSYSLPQTVHWK